MSYISRIWQDIYERAINDTSSGGLFETGSAIITGFYNTYAPVGIAFPYCVFVLENAAADDAMNTRVRKIEWSIHTYIAEEPASGVDGFGVYAKIHQQIIGDWELQGGRVPTHGFDRWQPGLAGSGWTASINEHVNSRTDHNDGVLHFIEDFRVWVSKAGL